MFDLSRQIQLKQAKNALRDGRLDEAFSIATRPSIREHRGGQILLGKLVTPLLDRARVHLEAGRLREARLDAERAVEAGGNTAEALALRLEVARAFDLDRKAHGAREELVVSARRHLDNGSLHAARERLEHAGPVVEDVSKLVRRAENQERRCGEAVDAAEAHLGRGEVFEALTRAGEAAAFGRKDERVDDLLNRLKGVAVEHIENHLVAARFETAARLAHAFRACYGETLETERFEKALALAERSARAFRSRDYEGVRIELGRLQRLLPGASWIGEHLSHLDRITEALRELRTGPIGTLSSDHNRTLTLDEAPRSSPAEGKREPRRLAEGALPQDFVAALPDRLLLWVDGVGTFLLITRERVTIGRCGSSARPTIALSGNIAGHHADILRVDDDYFVVAAQGAVRVDGRQTGRKLLADGDDVKLGERTHLTFRLPTALSGSAVLSLRGGQRLAADVQDIILVNENVILGPKRHSHIHAPGAATQVVLSLEDGRIVCRAKSDISVGGQKTGHEVQVELGSVVEVGDLTFTVTAANTKGV